MGLGTAFVLQVPLSYQIFGHPLVPFVSFGISPSFRERPGADNHGQGHNMERRLCVAWPALRSHFGPCKAHKRREHPPYEEGLRRRSVTARRRFPRVCLGFRLHRRRWRRIGSRR